MPDKNGTSFKQVEELEESDLPRNKMARRDTWVQVRGPDATVSCEVVGDGFRLEDIVIDERGSG